MKAKILAVAVAGGLMGCGSGGSFESAKGTPLVQEELPSYGVNGPSTFQEDRIYAEEKKGESLIQWQRVYAEAESKGPSLIQEQRVYAEHESNGPSAINEVDELAVCTRWPFFDNEIGCSYALGSINSGMTEAKEEFDKDPESFQLQAKGMVATAEGGIKRSLQRDATYPEVIEYLKEAVGATLNNVHDYWSKTGYAIATYYYVRGIPEGHTKTGNPGLCVDEYRCGDEYLKYQWN